MSGYHSRQNHFAALLALNKKKAGEEIFQAHLMNHLVKPGLRESQKSSPSPAKTPLALACLSK